MVARDPYRRTPRSMNEAYGPYAELTTDEEPHRNVRNEKRYAIISFIIILIIVGVVAYFHKW